MRIRYWFPVLALSSLLFARQEPPAPAAPPAQSRPKLTDVPLLNCSGLPCVELGMANGKTIRLLIDTGEANSYLDTKAAQSLGLSLEPMKGRDGTVISEVQRTVIPGAKLGDVDMGDFPFVVLDTTEQPGKPNEKLQPLPADGALTYGAFKNRMLQIDYPHRVVRLSEPQDTTQPCPHECTDLVIRHISANGPTTLTTRGFTVNNQTVEAQLDTLFTGTMLVYPGSIQKLGLKKESKSKQKEFFPFVQSGIQLAKAEGATEGYQALELMQNAPLYFMTAADRAPDVQFDVAVGSGLLSQGMVTFDFKGMHMWMEPGKP